MSGPSATKRSCNRHEDCDKAERGRRERTGETFIPVNFHCHNDECEDCFGA